MITITLKTFLPFKVMSKCFITISMLLMAFVVEAQTIEPLPEVDPSGVDMSFIYSLVSPSEATDISGVADITEGLENAEVASPGIIDFFNKERKHLKYNKEETAKWLLHFVLSGRLTEYLKKAHGIYSLVADDNKQLHEKFYEGYMVVSPEIINDEEVEEFMNSTYMIINKIGAIKSLINANRELLSDDEVEYFVKVLNNILTTKNAQLQEFENLTTDSLIVATHGQRLDLITKVSVSAKKINKGLSSVYYQLVGILNSRSDQVITTHTLRYFFE